MVHYRNRFEHNTSLSKLGTYVDDIFAVIPNRHIQGAFKLLNIQDNSLKFILETEIDGQLSFLDLKLTRNSNRLTFGIHRKPTHTGCYINSNGCNPKSQHVVFNSLVYRLLNTPLEQAEYTREYEHILNTAVTNGF